jgi:hypothetical protein
VCLYAVALCWRISPSSAHTKKRAHTRSRKRANIEQEKEQIILALAGFNRLQFKNKFLREGHRTPIVQGLKVTIFHSRKRARRQASSKI